MSKDGFTLIELTIVIVIIAIITAIAVPSLLTHRISANENSATGALSSLINTEATWFQQDYDCNNIKDYWTYDVSCLHRMYRSDNTTKVEFIPLEVAMADVALADPTGAADNLFGTPQIESWTNITTATKFGYLLQVLALDSPTGSTYKVNLVGTAGKAVAACHVGKFGFMAAPVEYGASGVNSFIVNQEGIIYANDTGGEANKWVTTVGGGLNWPGVNPVIIIDGPAGRKWRVAE